MDASKLDSKVVRMLSVSKRSTVGSMPSVPMSDILRMKEKARVENKTLAQIFNDEVHPKDYRTVSIEELKVLQAKADDDGISVGKAIAEAFKSEKPIIPEEPDSPSDPEPVTEVAADIAPPGMPPVEPVVEEVVPEAPVETGDPMVDLVVDAGYAGAAIPYSEMLDSHTYNDLKDLAKAGGVKFKGNIKKADLVAQIEAEVDSETATAYFGA